jgi:hypothetical protein
VNRFQRWLVRTVSRFVPQLRRAVDQAGGTIERLSETVAMYREQSEQQRDDVLARMTEMREAIAMASGSWMGLQESAGSKVESGAVVQLRERLAELELALEDRGWKRQLALADTEFSRYGIQQIILICRLMRIKNPIIQRGILVSAFYVFARGVEVTSADESANEVLTSFFNDPRNQSVIGHTALVKKEASKFTDGNIFWAFFTDVADGSTVIRTIDPIEITEIITDPDDAGVPWYYHRRWAQQQFDEKTGIRQPVMKDAWYVAMGHEPPRGVTAINQVKIMTDESGLFVPILHDKDGELEKWHFGCPRAYAAVDWARAGKEMLENYCTVLKAASRLTQQIKTKGGAPAIANLKQAFATTLASDGSSPEQNPPPNTASTWISGPGTEYSPIKTNGITTGPDEGRRVFLMAYMVFGLAEHFFADINSGNLATATSLDRPTQLMFEERQEQWKGTFGRMATYVLQRSLRAPKGRLREVCESKGVDPDRLVVEVVKGAKGTSPHIRLYEATKESRAAAVSVNVNFPPIIEGDIPALMGALIEALTLNGFEPTGIDQKTGIKAALSMVAAFANIEIDVEGIIEEMFPDAEYKKLMDRTPQLKFEQEQALTPPPVPGAGAPGAETPGIGAVPHPPAPRKPRPKRVKTAEALREFHRALKAYKESKGRKPAA